MEEKGEAGGFPEEAVILLVEDAERPPQVEKSLEFAGASL